MQSPRDDRRQEDPLRLTEADYDFGIFHPAFRRLYDGSDLYNYGYWRDAAGGPVRRLGDAAAGLVRLHVEQDPQRAVARRVLDAGCGLGACTALLAAAYPGAAVVGINYSEAQIAHARRHHAGPGISFLRMDAAALDFPDDSFDCIHCVEAAMHFRPRQRFLNEARRVLVPGGRLVVTDVLTDRATSFIPAENVVSTLDAYARLLEAAGLGPAIVRDIRAETAAPFAELLRRNAMAAYARGLDRTITGYVLAVATKPS